MAFITIDGQPVHTSTLAPTGPVEINREHPAIRAFLDASPEWRVALARELLVGTGSVVARNVGALGPVTKPKPLTEEYVAASLKRADWNDCRAAMMEGE